MPKSTAHAHPRRRFEWRLAAVLGLWLLLTLALGVALALLLPIGPIARGILVLGLLAVLSALWMLLFRSVADPLRGLANVVEAYRGGDYTLRGAREFPGDALGDLVHEINSLGNTLHGQRLRAMEATALLDKLVGAIDVAVLAFDGEGQLRLLNPAAAGLLGLSPDDAIGRSARALKVHDLLTENTHAQIVTAVAGRPGRWQVTHGAFREDGLAQHLLIVSDVSQALREEERGAWQRLIRVISHEVNNSLAPIKSLSSTLKETLGESLSAGQLRDDTLAALQVMAGRTDSLQRFLAQHSRLVRLPAPRRRWFPIKPLLSRVVTLEHEHHLEVHAPDGLEVCVDEDQLEQILINLVKNAIEAQGETQGVIAIDARDMRDRLLITVTDEGPGISNPDNLFVPFFTTKPGGSGIGLALSRQIAEAHGGTLCLQNRDDGAGAVATLEIPAAARWSSLKAV